MKVPEGNPEEYQEIISGGLSEGDIVMLGILYIAATAAGTRGPGEETIPPVPDED